MDINRSLFNFEIAVEAILANKLRSMLTALGIIFGVGAVIAMMAIGNGAQQEILDQMKLIGVNNIIVTPIVKQEEQSVTDSETSKEQKKFSPGLSLADVENIVSTLPNIGYHSPEIILDSYILRGGIQRSAKVIGVTGEYFPIYDFELDEGAFFSKKQELIGAPVCIIGKALKNRFFPQENPIGKRVKCDNKWLTVIGVLSERVVSGEAMEQLGIRNANLDIYIPANTLLIRYRDRHKITQDDVTKASEKAARGGTSKVNNNNQIDKIILQVDDTEKLSTAAQVVQRILSRRHNTVVDFEVTVPELLLRQQQRTKDIFNIVLSAIAGISLIVGGIGIMNIMLASVLERIKEIGLRISIGAKKSDIIQQFMFESILISMSGGVIGVILGGTMAFIISKVADIPTIISVMSIVVSFGVAATIGLIFGITPAKKAANQDPIKSLRHE